MRVLLAVSTNFTDNPRTYNFLNVCTFDYTAVARSGKVGPVNQVNHTSWEAVFTPTDRP